MAASPLPRLLLNGLLAALAVAAQPPEMLRIPGGDCPIGASVSHEEVHKPQIAPYWLARYPVTNAEYKQFIDSTGHAPPERNSFDSRYQLWNGREFSAAIARQPVVNVSWEDATAYCQWLSKQTGEVYRLPSEEEWEFAARGGLKGKPYPWGDSIAPELAWFGQKWKGAQTMQPVDYGKPNDYGLYGMAGNVWQWTGDWYVPTFNGRPVQEELKLYRVVRGGSWANEPDFLKVNYRNLHPPQFKDLSLGFRIAR